MIAIHRGYRPTIVQYLPRLLCLDGKNFSGRRRRRVKEEKHVDEDVLLDTPKHEAKFPNMCFEVSIVRVENTKESQDSYCVVLRCGHVEATTKEIPETLSMSETSGEYLHFDLWRRQDMVWLGSGRILRSSIRQSRLKPVRLRRVMIGSLVLVVRTIAIRLLSLSLFLTHTHTHTKTHTQIRASELIELNLDTSMMKKTKSSSDDVSLLSTSSRWTESLRQRSRKQQQHEREEKIMTTSFISTNRLVDLSTPKRISPKKKNTTFQGETVVAFGRHQTTDISNMKKNKKNKKSISPKRNDNKNSHTKLLREKMKTRRRRNQIRVCTHGKGMSLFLSLSHTYSLSLSLLHTHTRNILFQQDRHD